MGRLLPALIFAVCACTASALAAGPPLPTTASGSEGVAVGGVRYFTAPSGEYTIVRAERGGRVVRSARIRGRWAVVPATINGATTGLSADGSTLVLARPVHNFPPKTTPLVVLDAKSLRVRREITLRGFATVDAISPDGRWAYVLTYDGGDPLDYAVRALDTRSGALDPKPIVDPREPDEQMGGLPFARLMSHDGRWAYTLYGSGHEAFIHALDTVGRTAACIDLEMLPPESDLNDATLHLAGATLEVRRGDELVATVDRRTFAVSEPWERVYEEVLEALGWS